MEKSGKVWIIEKVPFAHASVNENKLFFPRDELERSYSSMDKKPVVINLSGNAPDDHDYMSSMSTVGWTKNPQFDGFTAYCDVEITNPEVGAKLERMTTDGTREINAVSMGAKMAPQCSVCGQMMTSDHEHKRGEVYDGREALAIASDTQFDHLALTNFQADKDSVLDSSKVYAVETATLKVSNFKVKKEVGGRFMENKTLEKSDGVQPDNGLEARLAALEAKISKMGETSLVKDRSENADVIPGSGQVDQVPVEKKTVGPEFVVAAEQPQAVETQKDEEDEKKKQLQMYATKYQNQLVSELSVRLNKSTKEFASKSVVELESMVEVARLVPSSRRAEVAQNASMVVATKSKGAFREMSAKDRIEKYGTAKSLELAYKHDAGLINE